MSIKEEYWTVSNAVNYGRKYSSKKAAIASTRGKTPTHGKKNFEIEHHKVIVEVEEVAPTVELPKEVYTYEEVKDIVSSIKEFLLEDDRYKMYFIDEKEDAYHEVFMFSNDILYNKEVQDMIGVDLKNIKEHNMYYYKPNEETSRLLIEGILSDKFLSSVAEIKLMSTNCDLKDCNGATIKIYTKYIDMIRNHNQEWRKLCKERRNNGEACPLIDLTIQVRPNDVVFHDNLIYGMHVDVRSWKYITVDEFKCMMDKSFKRIKQKMKGNIK
ncbi:MAG: hypothetical protein IKO36_03800 [Bacteroidaceae bacterium]|nr:hypothetical protein [Bacteroidaceae bacterium]